MNNRLLLIILTILTFCFARLEAQLYDYNNFTITINDIFNVRVYPAGAINMKLLASSAGNSMETQTNFSSYIQFTSIAPENEMRRITAIVSSGNIPAGTQLQLTTGTCASGSGTRGTPSSKISLDRSAQKNIITGIGSGYTGNSPTNGYNLVYTWGLDPMTYSQLRATSSVSITITFTVLSI